MKTIKESSDKRSACMIKVVISLLTDLRKLLLLKKDKLVILSSFLTISYQIASIAGMRKLDLKMKRTINQLCSLSSISKREKRAVRFMLLFQRLGVIFPLLFSLELLDAKVISKSSIWF
jgi:hypothetical protein